MNKPISSFCMAGVAFAVATMMSAMAVTVCRADGPATQPASAITVVAPANTARTAALLGKLEALAGTWEKVPSADKTLDHAGTVVFAKTAGGTSFREIMFPGTAFEMTNMYHMHGQSLVMTHYCASGNQPRMICQEPADGGNTFVFSLESATNVVDASQPVMAELTLTLSADGQLLTERWRTLEDGKLGGDVVFQLKRQAAAAPATPPAK